MLKVSRPVRALNTDAGSSKMNLLNGRNRGWLGLRDIQIICEVKNHGKQGRLSGNLCGHGILVQA